MPVIAHSRASRLARAVGSAVVVEQSRHTGFCDENDVAAVTAVAAVWSAERLELFAVHRHTPASAVTGGEVEHDAINECGHGLPSDHWGYPQIPGVEKAGSLCR